MLEDQRVYAVRRNVTEKKKEEDIQRKKIPKRNEITHTSNTKTGANNTGASKIAFVFVRTRKKKKKKYCCEPNSLLVAKEHNKDFVNCPLVLVYPLICTINQHTTPNQHCMDYLIILTSTKTYLPLHLRKKNYVLLHLFTIFLSFFLHFH